MDDFLKGSSMAVALPTMVYVGMAQRKNRLAAFSNSTDQATQEFLSIPYESIAVGIPIMYGITYTLLKYYNDDPSRKETMLFGAALGLTLSLIGRFVFDLPIKMFGLMETPWMVHIVAPILYTLIFVYVDKLLNKESIES